MFISFDRKESLKGAQFYVDKDFAIKDAAKLISVDADAKLAAVELLNKEAKVFYRIFFTVVYEDKDGKIKKEDAGQDYNTVLKDDSISAQAKHNIDVSVSNIEFAGTESPKIRATVSVGGFVFVGGEANCYPADDASVICKKQEISVEKAAAIKEAETLATLEAEVKTGVSEVLSYKTSAIITDASCGAEVTSASGECYTNIIYLSDGNVGNIMLTTPFSLDLLAEGATADSVAILDADAKSTTITLVDGEGSKALKLEIAVAVKGYAINKTVCAAVTDAYSKTHETLISHRDVTVCANDCAENLLAKFAGNAQVETVKKIRNVLAVGGHYAYADANVENNSLSAEGIVAAEVIYLSLDNTVERVLAEIPYKTVLSRDFACKDDLHAKAAVVSLRARPVGNDQIELAGELSFAVRGMSKSVVRVAESIELLDALAASDVAISLYLAEPGETLWDVAKQLRTDEQNLIAQNDGLQLPLKGGEQILCWNPFEC